MELPSSARVFASEPVSDLVERLRHSVGSAEAPGEIIELAVGDTTHDQKPSLTTRLDDFLVQRGLRSHERFLVKVVRWCGSERRVREGFSQVLTTADTAKVQVRITETRPADLEWMIETLVLHLVGLVEMNSVPVATLVIFTG